MKYTKKMKLVEIGDNILTSGTNNTIHLDDDSYLKPRVLSTLDNVMSEILRAPISDGDKWKLYSQALQRYLNHAKVTSRKSDCNFSVPMNNKESIPETEETFNFSLDNISDMHRTELSGISHIRDSIDSISQPSVRTFFEQARALSPSTSKRLSESVENVDLNSVQRPKKKTRKRIQPYRAKKRTAENSLSADLSRIRPCKVSVQRLNWQPTRAR